MSDLDDALAALVRKYPMALRIPDAIDRLAALTGVDRSTVHHAIDSAIYRGVVCFGDGWALTVPGAVANPRRPPLPLTAPDGRVFGWACAHCLTVGGAGCTMGGETPDERRAATAERSLWYAERCSACPTCGAFDPTHTEERGDCEACLAALKARQTKGAWWPCDDCKGTGEIGVERAGAALSVECSTCGGDCQVWRDAP